MGRLIIIIAGLLFIATGFVALFSDHNWQTAIFLFAIGIGFLVYFFRE